MAKPWHQADRAFVVLEGWANNALLRERGIEPRNWMICRHPNRVRIIHIRSMVA